MLRKVMIMLMSILILSCISCENLGNFGGSRSQAQAYPLSSHVNGNATIVAIETISRSQSIGLGTLAGAAVGGLLGYQVGGGTGKTVTTIAGAAGGAYVGHELEKQRNKDDRVYKVTLRMDDGTMQSFAQESEPILKQGDRVKISNGVVTKL